jgi:hypothetical protein
MAAPTGNQFWKLRSKHGRDKLFASPDLLWEAACEYFEWCEENPLIEVDFKGKDADRVELPKMRAFTLQGLCLYLGCNTDYFKNFRNQERVGIEDFSPVIAMIEDTIYNQKFTGAAAGFLNANIISRDLGLLDRSEIKHDLPKAFMNLDPLADDTANDGTEKNRPS